MAESNTEVRIRNEYRIEGGFHGKGIHSFLYFFLSGPDRSEKEVQFGETDQVGDFTMKHGDWIKFVIAVDRRDKHPRATKIELLDESFKVSDERREQGKVTTIKDAFGFIQCADRDAKIFFPLSECLDVTRQGMLSDINEGKVFIQKK